jgi:hypothetical protein
MSSSFFIGLDKGLHLKYIPKIPVWILEKSISYVSGNFVVKAPAGWVTDLTSIPSFLPLKKEGLHTPASIIHDVLYAEGEIRMEQSGVFQTVPVTRKEADQIYREAMKTLHVKKIKRRLIYWGVRMGGWRAWGRYRKGKKSRLMERAVSLLKLKKYF